MTTRIPVLTNAATRPVQPVTAAPPGYVEIAGSPQDDSLTAQPQQWKAWFTPGRGLDSLYGNEFSPDTVSLPLRRADVKVVDSLFESAGASVILQTPLGDKFLTSVERVRTTDSLLALDIALPDASQANGGGSTGRALALLFAVSQTVPTSAALSPWVAVSDQSAGMQDLAQRFLVSSAPQATLDQMAHHLHQQLFSRPAPPDLLAALRTRYETETVTPAAALLAEVAALPINTTRLQAQLTGQPIELQTSAFGY